MKREGAAHSNTPELRSPLPLPLPRAFYQQSPELVAQALLGKSLVSNLQDHCCIGRIVETEAYLSAHDPACHANRGRTKKNASMFGPPGHAYVYSIHAKWCFNAVTEPEDSASAVLIRALEPLVGETLMGVRRNTNVILNLARGPARLCQALGIDRRFDGWDLTSGSQLWIGETWETPPETLRLASPRIGISVAKDFLLRFYYAENRYVSGTKTFNQQGVPLAQTRK